MSIAYQLPESLIQGNALTLQVGFSDYPSTSWTGTMYFKGEGQLNTYTSTTSGTDFVFTLPNTTTALLPAGFYTVHIDVTKTTETYTVISGVVQVIASASKGASDYDARSHARRTLELLETSIENYLTNPVQSITINGRTVVKPTLEMLMTARDTYAARVRQEDNQGRIDRGQRSKKILARFT